MGVATGTTEVIPLPSKNSCSFNTISASEPVGGALWGGLPAGVACDIATLGMLSVEGLR